MYYAVVVCINVLFMCTHVVVVCTHVLMVLTYVVVVCYLPVGCLPLWWWYVPIWC